MKYVALILVLAVLVGGTLVGCQKKATGEEKAPSPDTLKAQAAGGKCGEMKSAFGMKGSMGKGEAKKGGSSKCGGQ